MTAGAAGRAARSLESADPAKDRGDAPDHEVVIVGSGFSGLGAAHALEEMGIDDFLLLEREAELGGTWVQHDYPGLEVDMPFFIYSFPFETRADWSQLYPTGREMRRYTLDFARRRGFDRKTRCNAEVERAEYDAEANLWRLRIRGGGELRARYLVSATGLLVVPRLPDLDGIEDFAGTLLHTARWDWSCDLEGRRVAVIGTGATGIQIVPAIADQVERLDVYQRTPIWLLPKPNPRLGPAAQRALRAFPFLHTLLRWSANLFVEISMGLGFVRYTRFPWIFDWIERKLAERVRGEIEDPEARDELIPDYSFFCKRPSFSNTFYATLNRPHVELVTEPIERVTPGGIVTTDGKEREVDVLVCATGYNVFNRRCVPGYELIGRDGVELGEFWEKSRYQAYEGATVPGFPNLFLFMGPYSAAGASYFTMIDTQSKHMVRCLEEARRRGANCIEVKQSAHDRDLEKVMRRRQTMVLFGGSCASANSYYFDARGDAPGMRPVTGFEHWLNSRRFPLDDYVFASRGA